MTSSNPNIVRFKKNAEHIDLQLRNKIMPYWYDTGIDHEFGGYILGDDGTGVRVIPPYKMIVTQARMVWGFSHAHRLELGDGTRDYLQAAAHGFRFLVDRFLDKKEGGYFWATDRAGLVTNNRKALYGQAFVIYALVEYFRANGDADALRYAIELFELIQSRGRDTINGGWFDHWEIDWTPLLVPPEKGGTVEIPGYKSANAYLHWMEALSELYDVSKERSVRTALVEALEINTTRFYPVNPIQSCFHQLPNWTRVTGGRSDGLSYGHNVEFAWLMLRAQEVLGEEKSWDHFHAHVRHALACGFDYGIGGLYAKGIGDQPAFITEKTWWVQAELLAALSDALHHEADEAYAIALEKLLDFIDQWMADPVDGIWYDTVSADGSGKRPAKAHGWKANYHDVRAMVKFVEAFKK